MTPSSRTDIPVLNPYDQSLIGVVERTSTCEVARRLDRAYAARAECRNMSKLTRASILTTMAASVGKKGEEYAKCIVAEAGKTIRQARKEVMRCVNTLTLAAEEAKRTHGQTLPFDAYSGSETRKGYYEMEPMGLVVGITPYNDPLNLVAHKLGPAIAAGNSFVLKPSELTPLSAMKLCQEAWDAGCSRNGLNIVNGGGDVGEALVSHPGVRVVSFTGGLGTADRIVRASGVKKFIMDLGGNAPVIVCDDADLVEAADACVSGAFWAAGQNCVGVQRILVQDTVYERFRSMIKMRIRALVVGDPRDEQTDVGPMIAPEVAARAWSVVEQALQEGAQMLWGRPPQGAVFYPTIVEQVPQTCELWLEEIFAPVVCLERFTDFESALDLANQPDSSLHAGIFTNDLRRAHRAIDRLEMGGVMVNDSSDYRIDSMPFGGFKAGSMGREGVRFAINEMMQSKVVCVRL